MMKYLARLLEFLGNVGFIIDAVPAEGFEVAARLAVWPLCRWPGLFRALSICTPLPPWPAPLPLFDFPGLAPPTPRLLQ